jgi:hypothetical protein
MTFSEETLMAYADNELDSQTRTAIEAAMAADPEVARRVAQHKAFRGRLRVAFDNVLYEPTPRRLINTARGVPAVRREGNVIPLRRKAPPRRAWPQWASVAASFVVGAIIGLVLVRNSASGPISFRDGRLLADGVLAHALSDQVAATQTDQAPVRIGVSFKAKAGEYCRTFSVNESTILAGIACRERDDWRVQMLTQTTPTTASDGVYRQPGSEMPRSVLQAVDAIMAGDPLDPRAETAARDNNWSP